MTTLHAGPSEVGTHARHRYAKRESKLGKSYTDPIYSLRMGHDDHSMRVENLPQKPPEPGQQALDF